MTIANALRRWGSAALTLLYPARCCACDADCDEESAFCADCAPGLEPIARGCPRCGLPAPPGDARALGEARLGDARAAPCLGCLERPPPYARASAPFLFGGPLARAIRRFKWGGRPDLGGPLARLLPTAPAAEAELIVPVPLYPKRLRVREFNQAAVLALELERRLARQLAARSGQLAARPGQLAARSGQLAARPGQLAARPGQLAARPGQLARPLAPRVELRALERVRDTPPQSALGGAERRHNVRGAFRASAERVAGRRVLLVDDVLTTGATAEACALALTDAGAAEVAILTLARAMP